MKPSDFQAALEAATGQRFDYVIFTPPPKAKGQHGVGMGRDGMTLGLLFPAPTSEHLEAALVRAVRFWTNGAGRPVLKS